MNQDIYTWSSDMYPLVKKRFDDRYASRMNKIKHVAGIVKQADIMWKAGEKDAKPCYYFLVGGNLPLHYKEPSYEEQIAQSWGCICSGVMCRAT